MRQRFLVFGLVIIVAACSIPEGVWRGARVSAMPTRQCVADAFNQFPDVTLTEVTSPDYTTWPQTPQRDRQDYQIQYGQRILSFHFRTMPKGVFYGYHLSGRKEFLDEETQGITILTAFEQALSQACGVALSEKKYGCENSSGLATCADRHIIFTRIAALGHDIAGDYADEVPEEYY